MYYILLLSIVICLNCIKYIYIILQIIIIRMGPDPAFLSRRFHLTQWCSELEKETRQDNDKRSIMEQNNPGASGHVTDTTQNILSSLDILLSENLHHKGHIKEVRSFLDVHLFTS